MTVRIDQLVVEGFRCVGERTKIDLDPDLTALVGANGSGKTAAMQALLRVFVATTAQRYLRRGDFHVRHGESPTAERRLSVEVHLSFPELDQDETAPESGIPAFFQQVCADVTAACAAVSGLRPPGRTTASTASSAPVVSVKR